MEAAWHRHLPFRVEVDPPLVEAEVVLADAQDGAHLAAGSVRGDHPAGADGLHVGEIGGAGPGVPPRQCQGDRIGVLRDVGQRPTLADIDRAVAADAGIDRGLDVGLVDRQVLGETGDTALTDRNVDQHITGGVDERARGR